MADVESDLFGIWVTSKIAAFDIDHFAKLGIPKTDFEINHFELYITSKMADFDNDH